MDDSLDWPRKRSLWYKGSVWTNILYHKSAGANRRGGTPSFVARQKDLWLLYHKSAGETGKAVRRLLPEGKRIYDTMFSTLRLSPQAVRKHGKFDLSGKFHSWGYYTTCLSAGQRQRTINAHSFAPYCPGEIQRIPEARSTESQKVCFAWDTKKPLFLRSGFFRK